MDIYQQNRHAHSVGWSTWHFEWCTKYRYKMFRKLSYNNLCVIAIQEAAKRYGIEIIDMEVDGDHVHIVCSMPLTMTPAKALHLLKGYSARLLFALVPDFRKRYPRGSIWSPGKFAASVGHITLEKAKAYLEAHHAKAFCHRAGAKHQPLIGIPAPKRSVGVANEVSNPLGRGGRQIVLVNFI